MKKIFVNLLCSFIPSRDIRHKIRKKMSCTNLVEYAEDKKYRFYGQFKPQVDEFIFKRYFSDLNYVGTCIECGAFDGIIDSSTKFFEETCGWKCYNIEAVPYIFEKLKKNRPNSNNFNFALSNKKGEHIFYFPIHPVLCKDFGNGSLNHTEEHKKELLDNNCTFDEFPVETTTYKDFIMGNNIDFVDLFVLDVEGVELDVIEGMKGCEVLPSVICVEYGHIGLDKIRKSLYYLGYIFDTISNANAFFIKKDMIDLLIFKNIDK